MAYQVSILPAALRAMQVIPKRDRARIREAIDALGDNPRPAGVKRLKGSGDLWRIRIGVYRALYRIEDENLFVLVVRVGHRREVYRTDAT